MIGKQIHQFKVVGKVGEGGMGEVFLAKGRYQLGIAYEQSGWNTKAVAEYQKFLDLWQNADDGLPEVEDAKKRLAALRT